MSDPRRLVPRTDAVLADPRLRSAASTLGTATVKDAVTRAQERARRGEIAASDVSGNTTVARFPIRISNRGARA